MPIFIDCLPRVKRCCCCHNLRVGSLIIGWCSLIASMITVIFYSMNFANPDIYPGVVKFNFLFLAIKRKAYDDEEDDRMLGTGITDLTCEVLYGIFTVIFLVGIYKEKAVFVMCWIYCTYIQLFRYVIVDIYSMTLKMLNHTSEADDIEIIGIALKIVISLCLTFYYIIVVASFYKEIVKNQEEASDSKT